MNTNQENPKLIYANNEKRHCRQSYVLRIVGVFMLVLLSFSTLAQSPFITIWKTDNTLHNSSAADQIIIPTTGSGYDYDLTWEEVGNTVNRDTLFNVTGDTTITFPSAGSYQVSISGDFPRIHFNNAGERLKILSIEQWGDISWTSMANSFYGCSNLVINASDAPDLSGVQSLEGMFNRATSMNSDLNNWDVSTITNMSSMFSEAANFNGNIISWDVSNVSDMSYTFYFATSFNSHISWWDVSNVVNMRSMFAFTSVFNSDIGDWDVSKVTNLRGTFTSASAFNRDITDWDVSNVTTMEVIFNGASSFNQDISQWDFGKVNNFRDFIAYTDLDVAFYDALLNKLADTPGLPSNQFQLVLGLKYSVVSEEARNKIASAPYNWTFSGDAFSSVTPPQFTSLDRAFVADGATGIVLDVNATYSDTGAPDSSVSYFNVAAEDLFRLNVNTTTGETSFTATPDFNDPRDADRDNVYRIRVQADNGSSTFNARFNYQYIDITVLESIVGPSSISTSDFPSCSDFSTTLTQVGGVLDSGQQFTWYKETCGGQPIGFGDSIDIASSDTLNYFVRIENDGAPVSACAMTLVEPDTANSLAINVVNQSDSIQTIGYEENKMLSVEVTGTNPVFQWEKNGEVLTDNAHITGSSTSDLTIIGIMAEDQGIYNCIVSNTCTVDSSSVFILEPNPLPSNTTCGTNLALDGINDYIEINSVANDMVSEDEFTIEMWLKSTNDGNENFFAVNSSSGSNVILIRFAAGKVKTWDLTTSRITSDNTYIDGQWHHIAYTHSGSVARLYVDGQLEEISFSAVHFFSASDSWSLGQEFDGATPSDFYEGSIDEVRIWNVERSAVEIAENMGQSLTGTETNLLAYYTFSDGKGSSSLNDLTSNNNHGTLISMDPNTDWELLDGTVQVGNNTSESIVIEACGTYTSPSGSEVWGSSGVYMDVIANSFGCDSTITINLTIKEVSSSNIDTVVCTGYNSPAGFSYDSTGVYVDTLTNAIGCDSLILINLTVTGNVWDGTSWCNGTPSGDGTEDIMIMDDYDSQVDGPLNVNNLVLDSGKNIMVSGEGTITIQGNLDNKGTINVGSGSSLLTYGEVTGTDFVIDRTTTFDITTGRYSILGSPVQDGLFADLGSNAIIYEYDESEQFNPTGNRGLDRFKVPANMNMTMGKGYFSAFTGDANGNVTFSGTPNHGDISIDVIRTDHSLVDVSEEATEGFNIIANPYPAAISYDKFMSANSGLTGTIYVWAEGTNAEGTRPSESDYVVINSMGAAGGSAANTNMYNGFIGTAQGFVVQATNVGTTTVNFADSMKIGGSNSDENFFRKGSRDQVRIIIRDEDDHSYNTLIGFDDQASEGYDRMLDAYFVPGTLNSPKIYGLQKGRKMSILALPTDVTSVKLGVFAPEKAVYSLEFSGQDYLLLDHVTGKSHQYGNPVMVELNEGDNLSRFSLIRKGIVASTELENDARWNVSINKADLIITHVGNTTIDVTLQSLNGSTVAEYQQVDLVDGMTSISLQNFSSAIYLCTVMSGNEIYQLKLLLNK